MFVYKEPTDEPILNTDRDPTGVTSKSYITGDRMSTFMIYLSEVIKYSKYDNPIYTTNNYANEVRKFRNLRK